MDKYIYDDTNGLWYERCGDYYLPCLVLPEQKGFGRWGRNIGHIFGNINARSTTLFSLKALLTNILRRSISKQRKCLSGWWSKLPYGKVSQNS